MPHHVAFVDTPAAPWWRSKSRERTAKPCRSARLPIDSSASRYSELLPGLTVELGRKENRRVLQNSVSPTQVLVLMFEFLEPSSLIGGDSEASTGIDLGPYGPRP